MQNEALRETQAALEESRDRCAARYAELYEFAPVGYLTLTDSQVIAEANLTAARLLGVERKQLLRQRFDRIVVAADRERWRRSFAEAMNSAAERTLDIELEHGGGANLLVHLDCRRLDSGRASPSLRLAVTDISERKREADLLRQAKAEAERANNAKSRFLAAASHDLRQPLAALSLYMTMLRDRLAPPDQPLLANMKDCIGSLSGLLTDLLDLSKLEAGVVTPNRSDFPVADLLASLASVHGPEAQLKGLRLRCISSAVTAYTDPVLYKRILGNLIDNAIRYTRRGGVLIGCRRRQGKTWVEVRDTGIGIPADKTADIFEEFKQLGDEARTRGSGLGLAIVAKTAALLGLEIRVRSWPGRGSLFAVELPLGQAPLLLAQEPRGGVCHALRVALVEDNAMVREAFVLGLQGAGHQVVAAATGALVRDELGDLAPDIVVSDYRLGRGETGFDVITALRAAMGADLPAILITGDTDPSLMRSMADRGIVVLHKPVDLETLLAYLEDLTWQDE